MANLLVIVLNLIFAGLLYLGLESNWWFGFNVISFLIWFLSLTYFSQIILDRIFLLPKTYTKLLSLFLNIILLGFISNIFTSWWAYNNLAFLTSLVITSLVVFFWSDWFKKIEPKPKIYLGTSDGVGVFKNWYFIAFLVAIIFGFWSIALSSTGNYLTSPWAVLPLSYLGFIFIVLLIIFSLVFSKQRVWLILVAIIIASFLMHSYLLVYSAGFGGDRWRHLGSENRILSEMTYQPTLLTDDIWYQSVAGVNIPKALIAGPKISYGFEWSLVVIINKVFKFNIFVIDKFLILGLWSVFLPLLVFGLARQLKAKNSLALLASALTLIFYLLQYYGAQTLPISFSVLYFIFFISGYLAYLKNRQKTILAFWIFLVALSYFGYALALIILFLSLIWLMAINIKPFIRYIIFFILSFSIFVAELMSGFSTLADQFSLTKISQAIISGNFLFFERGKFLLLDTRYLQVLALIISLLFMVAIFIFIIKMLKERQKSQEFLVGLSFILIINYLASWIFLAGLHSLARRMNVYIVLLLLMILAYGLSNLVKTKKQAGFVVMILSLVGILTYASGPVLEASVTIDDTSSMQYIWSQVSSSPKNYCVLADTWPLLALESYSAKEVRAGNFISDLNHQQVDRVRLFNDFVLNPSLAILAEATDITKTKACFVMINYNNLNPEKINQINNLLGESKIFGNNLVWEFNKKVKN